MSNNKSMDIKQIEETIGYIFMDKKILKTAFTHSSYAQEKGIESNERLEFLGDAVLNFIVSDMLYNRSITSEGAMSVKRSKIVSRLPLSKEIERLNLLSFLYLSAGFQSDKTTSDKFKSNLFEAITGAIYIDGGLSAASDFIKNTLLTNIKKGAIIDYKTNLQEALQARSITADCIIYKDKTISEVPPSFESCVVVNNKIMGKGCGNNKKKAQQQAAKEALEKMQDL